jgi:hypothetical protein
MSEEQLLPFVAIILPAQLLGESLDLDTTVLALTLISTLLIRQCVSK